MSFEVNGLKGKYDGLLSDSSVTYGRNAVENNLQYMEAPLRNDIYNPAPILDFSATESADVRNAKALQKFADKNDAYLNSLPPLEFEYRYAPLVFDQPLDRKAVLGAAYEEMGAKELSVEEFENRYLIDDTYTAKPLDINKDGKIDIAEYGANIIATDVLSKGTTDVTKADGVINAKGLNAVLAYTKKSNAEAAAKLYAEVYNRYQLGSALDSAKLQ